MPCACCAIGCDGCCIMPKDEKEYWRSTYPCGLMGCVPCCGKWGEPKCLKKGKKEDGDMHEYGDNLKAEFESLKVQLDEIRQLLGRTSMFGCNS